MSSEQFTPSVSVIMAVYNGGRTLPKTLDSLCNQTFKNFEIVVVNDESQDYSEGVLLDFQKGHPTMVIQYLTQKNKGLGGARNTAMRAAKAPILSLLDQDDVWYATKLEKVIQVFEENTNVSFVTHHLYRSVNGKIGEEIRCDFMARDLFQKLLFQENYFCGSAMSFRKSALGKIGYFSEDRQDIDLSEDYDYWLRAAANGLEFFILPEALGEYTVHTNNFSKNRLKMCRHEWNVVWKHYKQRPVRQWKDALKLIRRRGKILARQVLSFVS